MFVETDPKWKDGIIIPDITFPSHHHLGQIYHPRYSYVLRKIVKHLPTTDERYQYLNEINEIIVDNRMEVDIRIIYSTSEAWPSPKMIGFVLFCRNSADATHLTLRMADG